MREDDSLRNHPNIQGRSIHRKMCYNPHGADAA